MICRRRTGSVVVATTVASLCSAQCYEWHTDPPDGYRYPEYTDMVYDSARDTIVAFWQEGAELREWTPQTGWITRDIPGPAPRIHTSAAVTYDSGRGVMVFHGGRLRGGDRSMPDETWEYDGTSWTRRQVTGPGSLIGHAMAYDPVRNRIVLTGGTSDVNTFAPSNETWEYDGIAWSLVSAGGPQRWLHAAAFSAEENMVVVFGGMEADGSLPQETWGWNGSEWALLAATGPEGRESPSLSAAPGGNSLVLLGGLFAVPGGEPFHRYTPPDMWAFQNRTWQQIPFSTGPRGLAGHGAAYHAGLDELLVLNGAWYDTEYHPSSVDEMWGWNGDAWRFISGRPLSGGSLIAVPWRDEIFYWGFNGWGADAWWWDGEAWDLERGGVPQEGFPFSLALDTGRNVVVAYLHNGETWEMDESGWTLRSSTGPSPRYAAKIVYDSARQVTVLFGGATDRSTFLDETWEWDGSVWREHEPSTVWNQPRSSWATSMAFDQARGVTVLAEPWGATWEYDGLEWRQFGWTTSAPIVYDPISARVVAFTGRVWAWDGTQWIDEGPVQDWSFDFPPFDGYSMTFDPYRRRFWIYPVSDQPGQQRTFGSILVRSADHDRSGQTDVFDLLAYLADWFSGAAGADLSGDGLTDITDLLDHLDAWFEGC